MKTGRDASAHCYGRQPSCPPPTNTYHLLVPPFPSRPSLWVLIFQIWRRQMLSDASHSRNTLFCQSLPLTRGEESLRRRRCRSRVANGLSEREAQDERGAKPSPITLVTYRSKLPPHAPKVSGPGGIPLAALPARPLAIRSIRSDHRGGVLFSSCPVLHGRRIRFTE